MREECESLCKRIGVNENQNRTGKVQWPGIILNQEEGSGGNESGRANGVEDHNCPYSELHAWQVPLGRSGIGSIQIAVGQPIESHRGAPGENHTQQDSH
jgi:hypothetical protein